MYERSSVLILHMYMCNKYLETLSLRQYMSYVNNMNTGTLPAARPRAGAGRYSLAHFPLIPSRIRHNSRNYRTNLFLGHILYCETYFGKFCRGNVYDRTRVNPEKRNLSSPNQEREIIISMRPPLDQYKYLK